MHIPQHLPRYEPLRSYEENYRSAPAPVSVDVPPLEGRYRFCGLPVDSPLGIPAGPLLNGRWVLYYASLGFDILTYKTVRSAARECYAMPNLQPVQTGPLERSGSRVPAADSMRGSWAVSFGMPSRSPEVWRGDVEQTRKRLPSGKLLVVSVVGTAQPGGTIDDLARDYAQCARWAVESGADAVEANLSCPNVATCDGTLYQQPDSAAVVAAALRSAVEAVPLIVKIGHLTEPSWIDALLTAVGPHVSGIAMTNSIAAHVEGSQRRHMFGGEPRGICGDATRDASVRQVALFDKLLTAQRRQIRLIGVGGIGTAAHVRHYLEAGAESVQLATSAMVDPAVALKIRQNWQAAIPRPASSAGSR
ncbi:MAG: hypothetical protein WDZ59_01460 [Pirellulales bacterium]